MCSVLWGSAKLLTFFSFSAFGRFSTNQQARLVITQICYLFSATSYQCLMRISLYKQLVHPLSRFFVQSKPQLKLWRNKICFKFASPFTRADRAWRAQDTSKKTNMKWIRQWTSIISSAVPLCVYKRVERVICAILMVQLFRWWIPASCSRFVRHNAGKNEALKWALFFLALHYRLS